MQAQPNVTVAIILVRISFERPAKSLDITPWEHSQVMPRPSKPAGPPQPNSSEHHWVRGQSPLMLPVVGLGVTRRIDWQSKAGFAAGRCFSASARRFVPRVD